MEKAIGKFRFIAQLARMRISCETMIVQVEGSDLRGFTLADNKNPHQDVCENLLGGGPLG